MKTAELTGALLDYWVAKAAGKADPAIYDEQFCSLHGGPFHVFAPSTDWADGGPVFELAGIESMPSIDGWAARKGLEVHIEGPTRLIAEARAFVRSKFGEEVPGAAP